MPRPGRMTHRIHAGSSWAWRMDEADTVRVSLALGSRSLVIPPHTQAPLLALPSCAPEADAAGQTVLRGPRVGCGLDVGPVAATYPSQTA